MSVPVYKCKLTNNAGFNTRVVVISRYGQGDYTMDPGQSWLMQWSEGDKVLIAWDASSGRLLHTRQIRIVGSAAFEVYKKLKSAAAPDIDSPDAGLTATDFQDTGPVDTGTGS